MNSQTIKSDAGKPQLSLVPTEIIRNIATIREYGTKKYGDSENWRQVEIQRYRDAAYRHFLAYIENPHGRDEESGYPHLWHVACNIAFLCELEKGAFNDKTTINDSLSDLLDKLIESDRAVVERIYEDLSNKYCRKRKTSYNNKSENDSILSMFIL